MNPATNNPVTASAVALPPPQPHRPSTSCVRHPEERFTGFCPSCLFDRLSVLDVNSKNAVASSSSYRKLPSSSAAIFKPSSSSGISISKQVAVPDSVSPELRRTKSFSATKNEAFYSDAFEPRRRSCDVRVRNTLLSLFNEDDPIVKSPVFEEELEIESEQDINCGNLKEPRSVIDEIVEEEEEQTKRVEEEQMEFNPQIKKKPNRDFKEIAGSFLSAASVFSKKLQRWRQKQKLKKRQTGIGDGSAALPVEKSLGRKLRDTQSEIAEYGFGRRSCDTDPRFSIDAGRFSLDAGRVSVDDPRYSFDEPRASWDGSLMSRIAVPPRMPSMLSVVEDSPVRNHVLRSDTHIPVKESPPHPPAAVEEIIPGGTAQTREYYSDSSSRRRKSLDRSTSTRKMSASVIAEIDKLKLSASNNKVSLTQNRDAKDSISHSHSHSNSQRDDHSVENFKMCVRENTGSIESNKKETKKSRRWSWNIFGLLHRKNGKKYEEEGGRSGVDRTISESWNVETRKKVFDPKMMRSNSSVSWRSSGTGGEFQRRSVDGYFSGKKNAIGNGRNIDNGMLKFSSKGRGRRSTNSSAIG